MDCFVIDDEASVAQSICEYFELFELTCGYATNYQDGLKFLREHPVSVLLLDINLGNESGYSLCKEIRKDYDLPILFISARSSDADTLTAIGVGGDDLIPKPFSLAVLHAKVSAVLKRLNDRAANQILPTADNIALMLGNVRVDFLKNQLEKDNQIIHLKPMEWKLLSYLIEHKNRVLSKQELLDNVWQETFIGEGTLSVHIRHLREKIEENPNNPLIIKTIWGTGYLMEITL